MNRQGGETDKMTALEVACRHRGVPLTVQRRLILQALAGRHDHPTADQILQQVRKRLPEVSRTTVYRVPETFVDLGLAVKICIAWTFFSNSLSTYGMIVSANARAA